MDAARFDRFILSLATRASRRGVLTGLAGGLLTILPLTPGDDGVAARKKHRKKNGKSSRNTFGCVDVGKACRGNSGRCCSGICEGRKPKKGKKDTSRCAAHNVLDCPAGADSCVETATCGTSGFCQQTTGKAGFCAGFSFSDCAVNCTRDVDCEATRGAGAACIVCASACPGAGTMCVPAGA